MPVSETYTLALELITRFLLIGFADSRASLPPYFSFCFVADLLLEQKERNKGTKVC